MKLPKSFIPEHKKEIDLSNTKLPVINLEGLIMESINGMSCDEKTITKLVDSYFSDKIKMLGIKIESVERMAITRYKYNFNCITFFEYKTEADLTDNIKYFNKYLFNIEKKFLFKNNILIYLDGYNNFVEKGRSHYEDLGFECLTID